MPERRESDDRQIRLAYTAGALRVGGLQELLAVNHQVVDSVPVDKVPLSLTPEEGHHLQATAEGMSVVEISRDWDRLGGGSDLEPASKYVRATALRQQLLTQFSAENPPHLVTVACSVGHLACPELTLDPELFLDTEQVVTLGLLGRGMGAKAIKGASQINAQHRVTKLTGEFRSRLPGDSPTNITPWLTYTVLRCGVFPSSPAALENLDVAQLQDGVTELMNPERTFRFPPTNSPITAAAEPFLA